MDHSHHHNHGHHHHDHHINHEPTNSTGLDQHVMDSMKPISADGDHTHHNHTTTDSSHDHQGHMEHSMMMYFHASNEATILFSAWTVSTTLGMVISCLIVVALGILYEGLKVLREHLLMTNFNCFKNKSKSREPVATVAFNNDMIEVNNVPDCCKKQEMRNPSHFIQTAMHGFQVFHSYCLMLIFMTYNIWLCTSVVIGAIIGYFLFAWKRHKCNSCVPNSSYTMNDHCH